jgi:hypothetical protein
MEGAPPAALPEPEDERGGGGMAASGLELRCCVAVGVASGDGAGSLSAPTMGGRREVREEGKGSKLLSGVATLVAGEGRVGGGERFVSGGPAPTLPLDTPPRASENPGLLTFEAAAGCRMGGRAMAKPGGRPRPVLAAGGGLTNSGTSSRSLSSSAEDPSEELA